MTVLEIETSEGVPLRHELAGAGARAAAALLDLGLFAIFLILAVVGVFFLAAIDPVGLPGFLLGLLFGGMALSFVGFHTLLGTLGAGQTPGKAALGLRIVDMAGNPAHVWQLLLRAFFLPIEMALALPISLGILVMIVTRHKQRLGDLVAGTLVVREQRRVSWLEPFARETWTDLEPKRLELSPALATRFGKRDLAFLRQLFVRRGLDAPARESLFLASGRSFALRLGREAPAGPRNAYDLLRELFLYLREMRREGGAADQSESGRRNRPRKRSS